MREILFRGKRKDNEGWVYGSLLIQAGEWINKDELTPIEYRILGIRGENRLVDPKTVGEYTGLTDKNGVKIFEGDIAKGNSEYFAYSHPHGIIVYDSCEFLIAFDKALEDIENLGAWANDIEVIGNIFDNPELLKKE